jgi:hypothetical protein
MPDSRAGQAISNKAAARAKAKPRPQKTKSSTPRAPNWFDKQWKFVHTMMRFAIGFYQKPTVETLEKIHEKATMARATRFLMLVLPIVALCGIRGGFNGVLQMLIVPLLLLAGFCIAAFAVAAREKESLVIDDLVFDAILIWGPVALLSGALVLLLGAWFIPIALFAQLGVLLGFGYRLLDAAFDLFPSATWNSYLVGVLGSIGAYFLTAFLWLLR